MPLLARRAAGALLLGVLLGATACAPLTQKAAGPSPLLALPTSVSGKIAFSPPDGATDVTPDHAIVARSVAADAKLVSAIVTGDGSDLVPLKPVGGFFALQQALKTDTTYTVTATYQVGTGAGATSQTATSTFATVSTPKVTAVQPQQVGDAQSVTLTLDQAAKAVSVDGPVNATLAPDGLTVTIVPQTYAQGKTYAFTIRTKNAKGYEGQAQQESFTSLGAATASMYPADGSSNDGVGIPFKLTLSDPPQDRTDFANHLSVSATVTPAPAPAAMDPNNCTPNNTANDPNCAYANQTCPQYNEPVSTSGPLTVDAVWLTSTIVQLKPKTADGYWPADSTITLNAQVHGLKTQAGNWIDSDFKSSFQTADKRVIDVNLTSQDLVACRNGVPANEFLIASGIPKFATRVGTFYIRARVADEHMTNPDEGPGTPYWYDLNHVPWTQYFDQDRALHGAWWHPRTQPWGYPRSHGCVNVQDPTNNTGNPQALPQAHWLWNFDYIGDPVVVHGVTPGLTASSQPVA